MTNHRRTRRRRNPKCVICDNHRRALGNGRETDRRKSERREAAKEVASAYERYPTRTR